MARRVELPLETEARNAYYKDPARRAWALVAFMVEHEKDTVERRGTRQERQRDGNGRLVFRMTELSRQFLVPSAGYGGYYHPEPAANSRSDVIKAMAKEAEAEGWINRERERYGGVSNYALTETGRHVYRNTIRPRRDAFVKAYVQVPKPTLDRPAVTFAKVLPMVGPAADVTAYVRIGALQRLDEKGGSLPDCDRPHGGRRPGPRSR